jgi:glc operon protein GlcG
MTRIRYSLTAALLAGTLAVPASAQDKAVAPFGFEDALKIGNEGVKAAKARGRPFAIVVVNREGRVLVAMRMDGASFTNLEVAQAKATTSAATGVPTSAIEQGVDGGKHSLLTVPNLMAIGGGMPVMRGGQVVAGVGVSGGSPQDDQAVAEAGIGK